MEQDGAGGGSSLWRGHRVRLRGVEAEDWRWFAAWGRDDEVSRAAESVPFPESAAAGQRWTEGVATREWSHDRFRWVIVALEEDAVPVGTINTHSCDRRVGVFSYGVALAAGAQGRGYAAEAVRLVLRYYFEELGYQKAFVHVYEFNAGSRRLHERLGFVREGRLRRQAFAGGRHWDVLAYGLTREEFAAGGAGELPALAPLAATSTEVDGIAAEDEAP